MNEAEIGEDGIYKKNTQSNSLFHYVVQRERNEMCTQKFENIDLRKISNFARSGNTKEKSDELLIYEIAFLAFRERRTLCT